MCTDFSSEKLSQSLRFSWLFLYAFAGHSPGWNVHAFLYLYLERGGRDVCHTQYATLNYRVDGSGQNDSVKGAAIAMFVQFVRSALIWK